jgi:hypothetical protein
MNTSGFAGHRIVSSMSADIGIAKFHSAELSDFKTFNYKELLQLRIDVQHNVKDDHAFLRKYAIFRHLPSRNPSSDQDKFLHDSLRRRDYAMCQKLLESVGWRRPHG